MRLLLTSLTLACVLLAGCSDEPASETLQEPGNAATASGPAPAPEPASDAPDARSMLAFADKAASEDRLFEPAGDNAFEWYLAVLEAGEEEMDAGASGRRRLLDSMAEGDPRMQARAALGDLFPYGLIHAEQTWRSGQREDAERWMALLARVRPDSPGLARLRDFAARGAPAETPGNEVPAAASPSGRPVRPIAGGARSAAEGSATALSTPTPTPVPESGRVPAESTALARPEPPAAALSQPANAETSSRGDSPSSPPDREAATTDSNDAPDVAPGDDQPELLVQVAPRYPSRARRQRIEGWVGVRFRVSPDGSVDQVSVTAAEPEGVFDREAVGTVSRWRFSASDREHWLERRIDFLLDAR